MSGYWRRILIANAVAAVTAFGILGGFLHMSWLASGKALAASFIYANFIGGILASVMPRLSSWVPSRRNVTTWLVRFATITVVTIAGCVVATGLLIVVRLIDADEYLAELRGALWISLLLATSVCLVIIAFENVRGELDTTTLALRTKERDEAEARRLAAEAQLASLESRVQPHFLFNTLNSIAELIHDDPEGAERMTGQLASLLRSSLDEEAGRLIPLGDELAVVRDYLDIERVRFGDRLRYRLEIDDLATSARVPRLSVQTLVENSLKYAVSTKREGASVAVRAAATNGHVRIEVEDDGPGFDPTRMPAGHGLALLRSRLGMTFGDRAALTIDSRPGRTNVTIEIVKHDDPHRKDHQARKG